MKYLKIKDNVDLKEVETIIDFYEKHLKQRDEVIDEAINKLGRYADEMTNNGNAYAICVDLLDKLKNTKEIANE